MAGADRHALAALVGELENRPMSEFRSLPGPAAAALRRAEEIGEPELAHRARLLQACVLLRQGHTEEERTVRFSVHCGNQPDRPPASGIYRHSPPRGGDVSARPRGFEPLTFGSVGRSDTVAKPCSDGRT